jgi:hypothetical protein
MCVGRTKRYSLLKALLNPVTSFSFYNLLTEETSNLLTVYHGGMWDGKTPIKVNGRGALGVGAYFTPLKHVAEMYAKESGGNVVQVQLNIKNPLKIESGDRAHPVINALVQLGMKPEKAEVLVDREEEKFGYVGGQVKKLALQQGYDGIFQYFDGTLREVVIWNSMQVVHEPQV